MRKNHKALTSAIPAGKPGLKCRFFLPVLLASLFSIPCQADARKEITLIAPGGARAALEVLIPRFESKSGNKVKATFASGLGTKKQVAQGGDFDVPIIQRPFPEVLASGNVILKSLTPLANVAVGVAVRAGAPKPDISTPEAVKKMLLAARSISYPDPAGGAAAGVSFEKTIAKLGIGKQIQSKIKRASGGSAAMLLVAKGDVEIGLTFLSEMSGAGIEVVGPLPREISAPTELVGFVSTHAHDPIAARALLDYLASPAATGVYRAQRMLPGHGAQASLK
jgi:molybdate transport system substrate-binding protein